MDNFTELIKKFEQDNIDVLVCVRRFDKALCEKANKSALVTLHKEFSDQFVHLNRWSEMEKKLTDNDVRRQEELDKTRGEVHDFQGNIASEIDGICTEIIKKKLNQYERVVTAFSQFFNQDELNQLLDRKADLELI